jgi:hypothetical protein
MTSPGPACSGKLAAGAGETGKMVVAAAVPDIQPKMSLGSTAGGLERGRKGSFGRGMG